MVGGLPAGPPENPPKGGHPPHPGGGPSIPQPPEFGRPLPDPTGPPQPPPDEPGAEDLPDSPSERRRPVPMPSYPHIWDLPEPHLPDPRCTIGVRLGSREATHPPHSSLPRPVLPPL